MTESIDTLIVGGGQAALALSYCLRQRAVEHVALERTERLGHAWRDHRWDSFTLVTPNWMWRLPGDEYAEAEPDGFLARDAIVGRLEQYALRNALPALRDGHAVEAPTELDLATEGISTVIWSAGYVWDFSLVQAPIFDAFGYPVQTDDATAAPGLFFLGLPYLRKRSSGLFWGVGEDAARLAETIVEGA